MGWEGEEFTPPQLPALTASSAPCPAANTSECPGCTLPCCSDPATATHRLETAWLIEKPSTAGYPVYLRLVSLNGSAWTPDPWQATRYLTAAYTARDLAHLASLGIQATAVAHGFIYQPARLEVHCQDAPTPERSPE